MSMKGTPVHIRLPKITVGVVAAMMAAVAVATGSAAHAKTEKVREFSVYVHTETREGANDVGPAGPSTGDCRPFKGSVYAKPAFGTPIGFGTGLNCVVMVDPTTGMETRDDVVLYVLKRGEIQTGGIWTFDPDINKSVGTSVIYGGTGAFFGSRGTRLAEALGDNWWKITFRMVG